MKYAFITGRIPELSILEIKAVLSSQHIAPTSLSYTQSTLIATTEKPLDCTALIACLGGTIKIAEILDESLTGEKDSDAEVLHTIIERFTDDPSLRVTFGFSVYSLRPPARLRFKEFERLGLSVKKSLRGSAHSIRFIMPKENDTTLSSVTVEKQGLLKKNGVELLLLLDGSRMQIAKTLAVQPFEEFSFRDWNRPAKSMDVGMLPPKVARMMVNLSEITPHSQSTLLDPFCGLGTILQEALLSGHSHIFGSDISKKNIDATIKNLSWIAQEKNLSLTHVRTHVQDARSLTRSHKADSLAAIVTEPYLGPIVTKSGIKNLNSIIKELSALYLAFFREADVLLKKNGTLVIVFPVWLRGREKIFLPILQKLTVGTLSRVNLDVPDFGNRTDHASILISREGQHVARELCIFKKK